MALNRRATISTTNRICVRRLTLGGMAVFAYVLLPLAVLLERPVAAQSEVPDEARERLDNVREAITADEKSAAALAEAAVVQARELEILRAELRAAARAVHSHEAALYQNETELERLVGDATKKRAALDPRRVQLAGTLAALQRLSLRPITTLLVSPGDPGDVVRSGLLLRSVVPEIERQARILRDDIEVLGALRIRIEVRRSALQQAVVDLRRERGQLQVLSGRKNSILQQTRSARSAAEARVAILNEEAHTLEGLLLRLRENVADAEPSSRLNPGIPSSNFVSPSLSPVGSSIASAHGNFTPPVYGRVVQGFGTRTAAGQTARGITWQTRMDATVVSPWDGRIVFAGPFRRFGQILIIDHGEGYHSLIAGLERIEVEAGQWVLEGEPLGRTSKDTPSENGASEGTKFGGQAARAKDRTGGTKLYIEFRRDGQPINPLPWLAAQTNRTQG